MSDKQTVDIDDWICQRFEKGLKEAALHKIADGTLLSGSCTQESLNRQLELIKQGYGKGGKDVR